MGRPRSSLTKHFFYGNNIALVLKRARLLGKEKLFNHCFISNAMCDKNFLSDQSYCFPLYCYPDTSPQQTLYAYNERTPNLNVEIVQKIAEHLNLSFAPEKEDAKDTFTPIDILDYIYAVLHSPTYRETYKEFLKIDFPRIPYPKNQETFWQLVKLGGELRQLHLLESPKVEQYITRYPQDGDNTITRKITKNDFEITDEQNQIGRVWINDDQYFDNVPQIAWEFYIGGYQPAQKWLKDRRGRQLNFDDILHYQKIIVALAETDRIMKEIDEVNFMQYCPQSGNSIKTP
jgi:predicted helicase